MPEIPTIGIIRSEFPESADPDLMKASESSIIIDEDYAVGLDKIEEYDYLKIIFYLHKAKGYELVGPRRYGGVRGVFASRTPYRPAAIGVTVVKLLERQGEKLRIAGLDAIDGTPVFDIKPYVAEIDNPEIKFQQG